MKEFRERNTFIHIDTCGNIREFDDRTTLFQVSASCTCVVCSSYLYTTRYAIILAWKLLLTAVILMGD